MRKFTATLIAAFISALLFIAPASAPGSEFDSVQGDGDSQESNDWQ
ncbi:hypothetical protein [Glycomyces xiaoerkulensis]|nr:hypothetical protein [Glycomyces xiaoerkulensis]